MPPRLPRPPIGSSASAAARNLPSGLHARDEIGSGVPRLEFAMLPLAGGTSSVRQKAQEVPLHAPEFGQAPIQCLPRLGTVAPADFALGLGNPLKVMCLSGVCPHSRERLRRCRYVELGIAFPLRGQVSGAAHPLDSLLVGGLDPEQGNECADKDGEDRIHQRIAPQPLADAGHNPGGLRLNRSAFRDTPQVVGELPAIAITAARLFLEAPGHDGLQIRGNALVQLPHRHRFDRLNLLQGRGGGASLVGRLARQTFV